MGMVGEVSAQPPSGECRTRVNCAAEGSIDRRSCGWFFPLDTTLGLRGFTFFVAGFNAGGRPSGAEAYHQ